MKRVAVIGGVTLFLLLVATQMAIANEAQSLDDQAHELYQSGKYQLAMQLWQQAIPLYKKQNDHDAVTGAVVQVSHSQMSLGQVLNACLTLQRHLKADGAFCQPTKVNNRIEIPEVGDSENDSISAIAFARILRDLGLYDAASKYLVATKKAATLSDYSSLVDTVRIDQGSLLMLRLRHNRDRHTYSGALDISHSEFVDINDQFESAFELFESIEDSELQLEAGLKWLNLYQERLNHIQTFPRWNTKIVEEQRIIQYQNRLSRLKSPDLSSLTPYEHLRVTHESAKIFYRDWQKTGSLNARSIAFERAKSLIQVAKNSNQESFVAFGYGLLGDLFKDDNRPEQAIKAFQLASQNGNERNPLYQWQYEIAQQFQLIGNDRQAGRFYESAIDQINEKQWDYSPHSRELRVNFQENVKPVFTDYISFQLERKVPKLQSVLKIRDQLAQRNIENYLGCGTLETLEAEEIISQDPEAVLISIFKGNRDYYTIVQRKDSIDFSQTNRGDVDVALQKLSSSFGGNQEIPERLLQQHFGILHDRLIQPIMPHIEAGETILFSNLEPQLQQIPMSLLFDGTSYLVERNPIALVGNTVYEPKRLSSDQYEIFFAGLSQPSPKYSDFSALPAIREESININPNQIILDKSFTKSRFFNKLQLDFPIVHIASHGQFSSEPEQTFLLAYDDKIPLTDFADVVAERAERNPKPIELLVLSACETAKGDDHAALGMAGLSIQAGARSTLASLWISEDEATALLMDYFYDNLRSGKTKAESLQFAQIKLKNAGYPAFSWANFILTGSWL